MCKGGCCVPSTGIRRSDRDKARRRPYSSKARDMRGSRDYGTNNKTIKESLREGLLNESFPPNFNLNGCPSPNAQGPFPNNYSTGGWWNGGFQNTYDNANNQCNFLNNRFNAFMGQINQNMSSGPPSCSPKYSNMLFNKMEILRELSMRGQCNHSWT